LDLKTIGISFAIIFLAELGDKTQLAIFSLATKSNKGLSTFIGSSLALLASTLIAVLLGGYIGKYLPENVMRYVVSVLFFAFAVWTLLGKS